ncbi:DUF397 domain-containing protein [Streptomyces sp. NPDC093984]|uniref:DUF397 domain-containing protein n=1 Tax=Streptomyces sp. NPDC093984 TaxID=3366052 RepID=UPI0037F6BB5D
MRAIDLSGVAWRKSSYSNSDGGACVEVADNLPLVPVRDSKDPARGTLLFEAASWTRFIDELKRTEL